MLVNKAAYYKITQNDLKVTNPRDKSIYTQDLSIIKVGLL